MVEAPSLTPLKKKQEAKLPPPISKLARELVDRTRSSGIGRDCGASSRSKSDGGTTRTDKLDETSLVRAERTNAGSLHRSWSGIHFEPVECAVKWESSGGGEHIAALRERGDTQEGVDNAS